MGTPLSLLWSTWRKEISTSSYLKKFKVVTHADSELQGEDQIMTGILVLMSTQIASAMNI